VIFVVCRAPSLALALADHLAAGGTRSYTDDVAGNVTAKARTGGPYACTTNAAGRMSQFRINGVLQASYQYDAMG
jgi:hypothetical protein